MALEVTVYTVQVYTDRWEVRSYGTDYQSVANEYFQTLSESPKSQPVRMYAHSVVINNTDAHLIMDNQAASK